MRTKEWLKKQRELNNISQKLLAEKIGLSPFTIMQIEQGLRSGSNSTWEKIEKYFNDGIESKEELKYLVSFGFIDQDAFISETKEEFSNYNDANYFYENEKANITDSSTYKTISLDELICENGEIVEINNLKEYTYKQ